MTRDANRPPGREAKVLFMPTTGILTPAHREVERHIVETIGVADWSVLKRTGRTLVGRGTLRGTAVVVKWFASTGLDGAVKRFFGWGRGERHRLGGERLVAAGVRAPRTLSLTHVFTGPARGEFLVMERLPGKTLLHHLRDGGLSVRAQHTLARAVGDLLARLQARGLTNRDGKPSNLIVTRLSDEHAEVAVIDTVAIRRHLFMPVPLLRSLANLLIEPIGCGVAPRRTLRMRVYRAASGWKGRSAAWREDRTQDWLKIEYLLAVHGDPRPADDPLADAAA